MKKVRRSVLLLTTVIALASCGGGGDGTAGTAGGTTPVTPTPSPAPPLVAATARVYASSLATGVIEFTTGDIDTFGLYLSLGFTSRDGRYYPGFLNAIAAYTRIGTAPGASLTADYTDRFKRVDAVDHQTGSRMQLNAPASVRMVTPVTSMLVAPGSTADKLKTQLGIVGSVFSMVNNPDLATFDAVTEMGSGDAARAADGARMHAANLRVLTITSGLMAVAESNFYTTPGTGYPLGDVRNINTAVEALTAKCLNSGPNQFIFQNDRMAQVVQCYAGNFASVRMSTVKAQAVAHLIDTYAAAMPVRLESEDDKARWLLGLKGYLNPTIGRLVSAPDDTLAQAALSITTAAILNETARYTDHLPYNDTGLFMPGPDFLVLAGTTSLVIAPNILTGNDVVFSNERINTRGIDSSEGAIQSVAIPSVNGSQISVSRGTDGNYTVSALLGFKGVSHFDYVSKAKNGEERTGRVYVRVM